MSMYLTNEQNKKHLTTLCWNMWVIDVRLFSLSVLCYISYIFTSTPFYVGDKLIFRYKLCKSFGKRKALSKDKIPLGVSK